MSADAPEEVTVQRALDVRVHEAPRPPFGGEHTGTTASFAMLGALGAAYTVEASDQVLAGDIDVYYKDTEAMVDILTD